jgi:hypothetical protein
MDPLELVRSRNRADVALPSGLGATIGRVRIREAVLSGIIPLPILREWDALTEAAKKSLNGQADQESIAKVVDEADPSPDAIRGEVELRRECVRRSLKRLAPSVAELDGPEFDMPMEVIDELDQEDFDVLAGYAMRDVPFPAASLST